MAYQKQTFTDYETALTAEHLRHIEQGIVDNEAAIANKLSADDLQVATDAALAQAKESGAFDGSDGYSPTVSVSKSGKVTTVTITDESGKKTATINDGTSVAVSSITETKIGDEVISNTVTFSDGTGFTVNNGVNGQDGEDYVLTESDKTEIAGLIDVIPDYVTTEAERLATLVQSRQNENTITFMLSSDVHLSLTNTNANQMLESVTHAGQAMGIIKELIHIDFSAILGDLIWDGDTNTVGLQTLREVHRLMGEHDFWTEGNHDCQYDGETITRQQKFANIGKWNSGAVYDSENRLGGYCYRDYADYKLRVICLNTCENTTGDFTISTQQIDWLTSALTDMPEEYFAIILSHYPLNWLGNTTTIVNTIKNYKSKILATFHGHCHNYLVAEIGDTGIYRIAVPNVNFYRNNEYGENGGTEYGDIENGEDVTYNKTADSAEDTAFCVFTLDMASGMMYADHYGAGYDREIQLSLGDDSYTNLVPTALDYDLDGIYNGVGYRNGYYSSTTAPYTSAASDGSCVTGLFRLDWFGENNDGKIKPPTVFIKGVTFDTINSHNRFGFFRDDTKVVTTTKKVNELSAYYTIETLAEQYYKLTPIMNGEVNAFYTAYNSGSWQGQITHFAISANGDGANMIVTFDEEIT